MKSRLTKARKVRFGLRLKISAVMISAVVLTSLLLSFSVINQNINNVQDEMQRLGTTTLKGAVPQIEKYFSYKHRISNEDDSSNINDLTIEKAAELTKAGDYFKNIIKKERILDIAFFIENDYKIGTSWENKNNSIFNYFNRKTGQVSYRQRHDNQLKPSIYKYFMNNISTETKLVYREGRSKDENKFVIVGMPIFKDKYKKRIYKDYLEFEKLLFPDSSTVLRNKKALNPEKINSTKRFYENLFIKRLAFENKTDYNYNIVIDKTEIDSLFFIFPYYTDFNNLQAEQKDKIKKQFTELLNKKYKNNAINLSTIKQAFYSLSKNYKLSINNDIEESDLWKLYFYVLDKKNIQQKSPEPLNKLAISSFRSDLDGILGLFLFRNQFFAEIEKDRNEIINLAVSITLRCIIIALFLPTTILRKINRLALGAEQIGKGAFDTKIDIKGSDELARLSDIFNIMTKNLEKAQLTLLEKQRMEEELKTAEAIQKALLPEQFPDLSNIKFSSYYSAQSESGGDYFDIIVLDDKNIGLVIADVSGHGVGSGLVMAMTRTIMHTFAKDSNSPKALLEKANEYLYNNTASNFFVSMFYGVLNTETLKLSYCSAGHPEGLILRNGKIKEIPAGGIALGAVGHTSFSALIKQKSVQLNSKDCFLLYTDGIVEAMDNEGNEYGEKQFYNSIEESKTSNPDTVIKNAVKAINRHTGSAPQNDDITMLCMKVT